MLVPFTGDFAQGAAFNQDKVATSSHGCQVETGDETLSRSDLLRFTGYLMELWEKAQCEGTSDGGILTLLAHQPNTAQSKIPLLH